MTLFNRHWSRYFKKWNYAAFDLWGLSLFLLNSFKIHPLCSMNLTCSGASLVLAEYLLYVYITFCLSMPLYCKEACVNSI